MTICVNRNSLSFQTRQMNRTSPHWFYITRDEFEAAERQYSVLVSDIHSFAKLRLDRKHGLLEVEFTWLSGGEYRLEGYEQTVRLPWEKIQELLHVPYEEMNEHTYKLLSMPPAQSRPRLVFQSSRNLRAALSRPRIRHKLSKALMANFNYPDSDEIRLYDDFTPYGFFWREFRDGHAGICGGLILHGQENMDKAYYGIHT